MILEEISRETVGFPEMIGSSNESLLGPLDEVGEWSNLLLRIKAPTTYFSFLQV